MANYSVRRRNTVAMVTMSTLSLLLVFLRMTTLSSTAQAGRGGGVAGLFRFVDRKHELQQQRRDAAATDEDDFSSTVNINHHLHPLFQFPKDFNFSNNEISSDNVLCNEAVDFCSTGTAISEDDSITEDNDINNNNEFLSKLLASPSALQCRGGTSTISPTTSSSTMEVHTGRLDTAEKAKRHGKLEFSLFQNGDGSDKDSDGIPDRYMAMQLQRRPLAYQATRATLTWREKHEINSILSRPHPDFDVAKAVFPHYFVGRDVNGHVVFVQRPALLNLKLAAKNGLHQKALLDHYIYVNEYLWQIVEANDAMATMTGIMDMSGLNLSVISKPDIMGFMKEFVQTMDSHYPQRAHKTVIVNAPKWFHVLYKIVSPLLRESTKSRIEIHARGKRQDKALQDFLGKDAEKLLPESFFSKKKNGDRNKKQQDDDNHDEDGDGHELPVLLSETPVVSDLERDLRAFTVERLVEAGITMQEVVPV